MIEVVRQIINEAATLPARGQIAWEFTKSNNFVTVPKSTENAHRRTISA
jgi:hypothetical protein